MFTEWDKNKSEQELFEEYEYLVRYVLKDFSNVAKEDYEDLYQEGCIALLKVVRKFKETEDYKSVDYVIPIIRNRCKRYYQKQSTTLHVSRRLISKAMSQSEEATKEIMYLATAVSSDEESIDKYIFVKQKELPENTALAPIQFEEILKAVSRLSENRKNILMEYFRCNMDVAETATRCGVSTRTVYRARAFLREKIRYLKILEKDLSDV